MDLENSFWATCERQLASFNKMLNLWAHKLTVAEFVEKCNVPGRFVLRALTRKFSIWQLVRPFTRQVTDTARQRQSAISRKNSVEADRNTYASVRPYVCPVKLNSGHVWGKLEHPTASPVA